MAAARTMAARQRKYFIMPPFYLRIDTSENEQLDKKSTYNPRQELTLNGNA
jgi:hypothetical protein